MILFNYFRYANWMDAGYYKAIVTIDGAYDFEVIFLVSVRGEISCEYLRQNWSKSLYCAFFGYHGNYCPFYVECYLLSYDRTWLHSLLTLISSCYLFQPTTSTCQRESLLWIEKLSGSIKSYVRHAIDNDKQ